MRNADECLPAVAKAFRDTEVADRGKEGAETTAFAAGNQRRPLTSTTPQTLLSSTQRPAPIPPFRPLQRPIPPSTAAAVAAAASNNQIS